jgi:uncharacterized protein
LIIDRCDLSSAIVLTAGSREKEASMSETNTRPSPFHAGEILVQDRAGVRDRAARIGGNIRSAMPDQHRRFFNEIDLLLLGALDATGHPWATVLFIDALPELDDPARAGIMSGNDVGLLGLMPQNRRRNRLNGRIDAVGTEGLSLTVTQSFGNCPQYIQTRTRYPGVVANRPLAERGDTLTDAQRAWIAAADTFFIASRSGADTQNGTSHGVDVSHRGGRPGFVKVEQDGALVWPDFSGNNFFNTLGNLVVDPRAGLLFVDFERGDTLQISGTAEIVWDAAEVEAFKGARRLIRFRPGAVVLRRSVLSVRFELDEPSPVLADTGTWADAERIRAAILARDTYRPFTVARIVAESATIRSFYLTPGDGGGVVPHKPGQYLPIRMTVAGQPKPILRTYTVSDATNPEGLRITVKREPEGVASTHLHDAINVGDTIEAMAPRGAFLLNEASNRPIVLLSAGVGITPMIAMVNHMVREGARTGEFRQIVIVHGARDGAELAFGNHLRRLATHAPGVNLHIRFSQPRDADELGQDYASVGRIDIALLQALLPFGDYDFYLCGPGGFVSDLHNGLRALNVAKDRIHYEFFGSSTGLDPSGPGMVDAAPAEVTFAVSGKTVAWTPTDGSLLDLAEAAGVPVDSSCRSGRCGTCAVRIQDGEVGYRSPADTPVPAGHALICQAHPIGAVTLEA